MKRNRLLICLLILLGGRGGFPADWRTAVSEQLSKSQGYREVVSLLVQNFGEIDGMDKPTVCALLAFCFHRLRDKASEYYWLKEFYEKYRGAGILFDFLAESTRAEIFQYLGIWEHKYALITEIGLIQSSSHGASFPPEKLVIALQLKNRAFYKLLNEEQTLKGGLFQPGFNSFSLEIPGLWEKSGSRRYYLELKAEDLILKKELEVEVRLEPGDFFQKTEVKTKLKEYKLSLYLGDRLVISSTKTREDKLSLNLNLPPSHGKFQPFGPPEKDDPALNSFSIFDALAGAYHLLKSLKGKEAEGERVAPIRISPQLVLDLVTIDSEGVERRARASVTLHTKNLDS